MSLLDEWESAFIRLTRDRHSRVQLKTSLKRKLPPRSKTKSSHDAREKTKKHATTKTKCFKESGSRHGPGLRGMKSVWQGR